MDLADLSPETQRTVEAEIRPDEQVLWVGKPSAASQRAASCGIFIFAIPWTAFSVFWMYMASQGSIFFALFGLPFLAIGLGMLSSPIWMKNMAKHTVYVITTRRAIRFSRVWRQDNISSYGPDVLNTMKKIVNRDGSGDLIFEEIARAKGAPERVGFMGLSDVREVEDMLRKMH